jgi:polyisoprenoid-binding protein YceI
MGLAAVAALTAGAASARTFELVPSESAVTIHVGTSGLLSDFGHEHDVSAPAFSGTVTFDPKDLTQAHVSATFDAQRLIVVHEREPKDTEKVQATMRGPRVLDSARYPRIRFTSLRCLVREVRPEVYEARVDGELELHGVKRPLSVPLRLEVSKDQLIAHGNVALRQTQFGIKPVRIAGGAITVPDEVTVRLELMGHRTS